MDLADFKPVNSTVCAMSCAARRRRQSRIVRARASAREGRDRAHRPDGARRPDARRARALSRSRAIATVRVNTRVVVVVVVDVP